MRKTGFGFPEEKIHTAARRAVLAYRSGCSRWQSGTRRRRAPGRGRRGGGVSWRSEGALARGTRRSREKIRGKTFFEKMERVKTGRTSGNWTSFMKRTPRFSSTMPSEAAKKARMWLMKCRSSSVRFSQCFLSSLRSTSSATQVGRSSGSKSELVCSVWSAFIREAVWRRANRSQKRVGTNALGALEGDSGGLGTHRSRRTPRPSCTSPRCRGSKLNWKQSLKMVHNFFA